MKSQSSGPQVSGCVGARKTFQLFVASVGLLLLCLPAFPQLNLGSVSGILTDSSGAVIAGATVTVTDVERGVPRTLTTDTAGQYSATSLTPGNYSVRAEFMGFQTLNRAGISVGVGQAVRVDLVMQPGAQTQTVTVNEAAPLVDTTNAVLSSTVESPQLSQLPINGRLYTKVMDFQPGVHGNPGGNSPNYETNGAGGQGNYFLLDGVENTNLFVNSGPLIGAATSTDELTILPQDAVDEVNVMTNPPPEYGWFQGAVVNVGLKSGTNTLHGSAYGFFRNNNFDAYDPYLLQGPVAVPKQTDDFKQFGGSLGGPIKKDKLFYFGAYDGLRYDVGSGSFANVPTTAALPDPTNLTSVPNAIENMINILGVTPSPLGLSLANCTVTGAAPSAKANCETKGVFFNNSSTTVGIPVSGINVGHSNNVIGKIDYHPNDRSSINGEYFFGQALTTTPNPGEAPWWSNTNLSRTQMVRGVWTYTPNSSWVNDLRFGYNRYNLEDGNSECGRSVGQPDYASLGFISGANPPSPFCGFPSVNFNGAAGFFPFGAGSGLANQGVFQNTYTIDEDVSYIRGKHNFKFGFEFHHTKFQGVGAPGGLTGTLNYNDGISTGQLNTSAACSACTDLQNFLAGNIANGQILANPQLENTSVGFNREALYFADDFRLNSRVTVNLGLRYELEPAMLVDNNNAANFDPHSPTGMVQQNSAPLYKPYYKAFGPRAGFAWDITGKGTTVLRAGTGISYDTPQIDDLLASGFGAGLNSIPTGFSLYNDTGLVFPASTNSQAVRSAQLNIPGVGLSWTSGTPVFNITAADLGCGTGNPAITLPDGAVPSPCTLKAKGTVVSGPNGQFSFNDSSIRSPMVTWTLGIQHAFGTTTSLTVNYVGTHAYNLPSEININQPAPGASANANVASALQGGYGANGTVTGPPQQRQPYFGQFPWFNGIFVYGPGGYSNYNALQVSFIQRNFHSLTMNAAYTFSRDLATPKGGNNPYITDSRLVSLDYGLQTPTQDLGVTLVYNLPAAKAPLQLLQGWQISSTLNIQSGAPFNGVDGSNDLAGVGGGRGFFGGANEPWSLYGKGSNFTNLGKFAPVPCYGFGGAFGCNPALPQACISAANAEPVNAAMNAQIPGSSSGLASLKQFGCYMSTNGNAVIVPPAQGTFGNMRPGALIGAPFHEVDLSISKSWRIRERLNVQTSIAAFNVFNFTGYALNPFTGSLANVPALFGVSSQDPNNGNPVNGTGGPREVLLGLKTTF